MHIFAYHVCIIVRLMKRFAQCRFAPQILYAADNRDELRGSTASCSALDGASWATLLSARVDRKNCKQRKPVSEETHDLQEAHQHRRNLFSAGATQS